MPFLPPDQPLALEFVDGHVWVVHASFGYQDQAHDPVWVVTVPAGFRTDLASVPRGLWNLLPPAGRYAAAAILHDYLYVTGKVGDVAVTRGYADGVLRQVSKEVGVGWWIRTAMWVGVRTFAGGLWTARRAAATGATP